MYSVRRHFRTNRTRVADLLIAATALVQPEANGALVIYTPDVD